MSTNAPERYALRVLVAELVAGAVAAVIFNVGGSAGGGELGIQVATVVGGVVAAAGIYVVSIAVLLRRAGTARGTLELLAVAPHSFVACIVAVGAAHPGTFLVSAIAAPVLVWWRSTSATVK